MFFSRISYHETTLYSHLIIILCNMLKAPYCHRDITRHIRLCLGRFCRYELRSFWLVKLWLVSVSFANVKKIRIPTITCKEDDTVQMILVTKHFCYNELSLSSVLYERLTLPHLLGYINYLHFYMPPGLN